MSVNENIVKGKKYRILTDAASRLWDRISFWTASTDVEMADGHTLEANLGAIKGITTSTNVSTTGYAADARTVSTINSNMGGLRFGQKDGRYGYFTGAGADTFNPFNSGGRERILLAENLNGAGTISSSRIQEACSQVGLNINQLSKNNFEIVITGMRVGVVRSTAMYIGDVYNDASPQAYSYDENSHVYNYNTGSFVLGGSGSIWIQFEAFSYYAAVAVPGRGNWVNAWYHEGGPYSGGGSFNEVYEFACTVHPVVSIYLTY